MRRIFGLLALSVLLTGCAGAGPTRAGGTEPDVAEAGGTAFALDGCTISTEGAAPVSLDMPTPCFFVREEDGALQSLDIDGTPVALVASSTATGDARICDTRIRAVLLDPVGPRPSRDEQRIASCWKGPQDRLMLEVLADSIPPS